MVAPGHGVCVCLPRAVLPDRWALVLVCQCPVHVPRGTPTPPPPPPVQVCIKRRDRYQPVDAARLDLGDHKVTLTPPRGSPIGDHHAHGGQGHLRQGPRRASPVPLASGAQMLRNAEWKGRSVG